MRVVSFFSGIGGLDKGFLDAGYNVVWANDFDKYAVQTYKANYDNEIILGDINEIDLNDIPDCDVIKRSTLEKNMDRYLKSIMLF